MNTPTIQKWFAFHPCTSFVPWHSHGVGAFFSGAARRTWFSFLAGNPCSDTLGHQFSAKYMMCVVFFREMLNNIIFKTGNWHLRAANPSKSCTETTLKHSALKLVCGLLIRGNGCIFFLIRRGIFPLPTHGALLGLPE